ncbi:hypothetical protein AB4037_28070 [Labrys sp. KB_33_2]|uniref:hypothetical protein n=1 Tax=Labrys sp. KB_33_2 TaxID=3237479 RepID=UPI003F91BACA
MRKISRFVTIVTLLLAACTVQPRQASVGASIRQDFRSKCKVPDFATLIINDRAKAKVEAAVYMRCLNGEARQQGLQRAKPVCVAKGVRGGTAEMRQCQLAEGHAQCLRSIRDYQGYASQLGSANTNGPTAESTCAQIYH